MTINDYRAHVERLRNDVTRAKFYAETTGQTAHWDWYYSAQRKVRAAERYLCKREKKEAVA